MTELLGRLHPLAVHLPIGFLALLAALEVVAARPGHRHLAAARGFILGLTVPAAAFSALCGWLLSTAGGYDPTILAWHRWLGVSLVVASAGLFGLRRNGAGRTYRSLLAATVILLAAVGHLGASLTHGTDYLSAPLRKILGREPAGNSPGTHAYPSRQPVFAAAIQPVFNRYCVACHGGEKPKAGLRLDTAAHLERGGESGAVIVPGSAASSLLIQRLTLPPGHEDHMPPAGKRQPAAGEIALLRWWIDAGAPTDKTAVELNPPEAIWNTLRPQAAIPR